MITNNTYEKGDFGHEPANQRQIREEAEMAPSISTVKGILISGIRSILFCLRFDVLLHGNFCFDFLLYLDFCLDVLHLDAKDNRNFISGLCRDALCYDACCMSLYGREDSAGNRPIGYFHPFSIAIACAGAGAWRQRFGHRPLQRTRPLMERV